MKCMYNLHINRKFMNGPPYIQWNPTYEHILFAPKMWPFKKGGFFFVKIHEKHILWNVH